MQSTDHVVEVVEDEARGEPTLAGAEGDLAQPLNKYCTGLVQIARLGSFFFEREFLSKA
jgi:hypothetical protein